MVADSFRFELLSPTQAANMRAAWERLEDEALEPAPFNLAAMQIPNLALRRATKLACVWRGPDLQMALPLQSRPWVDVALWSDFTASSLPHLAKAHAGAALNYLVTHLRRPVLFRELPLGSGFYEALQQSGAKITVLRQWQRAALALNGTYQAWLDDNFDAKRRKEFKRLKARLAEQGTFSFEVLAREGDPRPFMENFLALEAKGWKGASGTALGKSQSSAAHFRAAGEGLHRQQRLRFWSYTLNGRPIAMLFGAVEAGEAAIIKIAYDETLAKFSPGTLLVLDATESLFGEGAQRADSCADPNHPMIDRIWRGRLDFGNVLVSPPAASSARTRLAVLAVNGEAKARGLARRILRR